MKLQIKARIRKYLSERKLKKSLYGSWRSYRHNRDTDVYRYADKVSDFYSGYKYVYQCDNHSHYAYHRIHDYGPGEKRFGYNDMRDWCELRCRFKYRADVHRVTKQTGLGINNEEYPDWYFNDIVGIDFVYFAFQNEQDYIMFLLRWN